MARQYNPPMSHHQNSMAEQEMPLEGPTMMARKDTHWGKRKLKRDQ